MATWLPSLLTAELLIVLTIGASTGEYHTSFGNDDSRKFIYAMTNVSHALQCFGESISASFRNNDNTLNRFRDLLYQSLLIHEVNSNCAANLDRCHGIVESLTAATNNLTSQLVDKDKKVELLSQTSENLTSLIADKDQKVESLTQAVNNLTSQLVDKNKKVVAVLLSAGYQHFPGFGFYKFVPQAATWADAVQNCKANGTQLGIVNSREEAKIYSQILANPPTIVGARNLNYFHSGFSEIRNTRQFQTLDGVALTESGYSEWDHGEPNHSAEQCGSMNKYAKLNDIPCSVKFAYICELEYS